MKVRGGEKHWLFGLCWTTRFGPFEFYSVFRVRYLTAPVQLRGNSTVEFSYRRRGATRYTSTVIRRHGNLGKDCQLGILLSTATIIWWLPQCVWWICFSLQPRDMVNYVMARCRGGEMPPMSNKIYNPTSYSSPLFFLLQNFLIQLERQDF